MIDIYPRLKEGVWIPIVQINSIEYTIKLDGFEQPYCDKWEQKIEYDGFNIKVKDGLWIADIGHFLEFDKDELTGHEVSYQTLDGETIYSGHKYDVPLGSISYQLKVLHEKSHWSIPNPIMDFCFLSRG